MEGFEKVHIAGVRHLIDLALSSPRKKSPRFVFVSSIATVSRHQGDAAAPEGPVLDESYASLGYGMAKLAGERICEVAAEKAELDTAIIRIGQISYVSR
jgi:nucleoside-diphosphate-sugar epimerase